MSVISCLTIFWFSQFYHGPLAYNFTFIFLAKPLKLDVGFVIGANGKNAPRAFFTEKALIEKLVRNYNVAKADAIFGAITYNRDADVEFAFGELPDVEKVITRIKSLRRTKTGNNIQRALELARDNLFAPAGALRTNSDKVLVLFTDKISMNDKNVFDIAKRIRDSGVKILAIGIKPGAEKEALKRLTGDQENIFVIEDLLQNTDVLIPKVAKALLSIQG